MSTSTQTLLLSDAQNIIETAEKDGLTLRLIGTLAVMSHSPSANTPEFAKIPKDLDLVGYSKQKKRVEKLLETLDYTPNRHFNGMHGFKRLIFTNPKHNYQVDVFIDVMEMCHTLDFRGRLELDRPTVPLSDLLASKLQIVQLTEPDLKHMIALLKDHELGNDDSDREKINVDHLGRMCGDDWGVYTTFTKTLNMLKAEAGNYLKQNDLETVRNRADDMLEVFAKQPKSMRWKVRATVGERVSWYQSPEVDRAADKFKHVDERKISSTVQIVACRSVSLFFSEL